MGKARGPGVGRGRAEPSILGPFSPRTVCSLRDEQAFDQPVGPEDPPVVLSLPGASGNRGPPTSFGLGPGGLHPGPSASNVSTLHLVTPDCCAPRCPTEANKQSWEDDNLTLGLSCFSSNVQRQNLLHNRKKIKTKTYKEMT